MQKIRVLIFDTWYTFDMDRKSYDEFIEWLEYDPTRAEMVYQIKKPTIKLYNTNGEMMVLFRDKILAVKIL
jgi:hypothetical protein